MDKETSAAGVNVLVNTILDMFNEDHPPANDPRLKPIKGRVVHVLLKETDSGNFVIKSYNIEKFNRSVLAAAVTEAATDNEMLIPLGLAEGPNSYFMPVVVDPDEAYGFTHGSPLKAQEVC